MKKLLVLFLLGFSTSVVMAQRNLGMQPISSESVPSIKAGINKKQQKTKSKTNDVIQKANQVMSQVAITPETKKQLKLALYPANKEVESEMLPVFVPITSAQEAKINRHDNSVVEYESIEENQKKIKKVRHIRVWL